MTTATRPIRSRRGRVMIVGDIPELASVMPQLQQLPVVAKTMFDALGEIAIAPAGAPITTVLLSQRCLLSQSGRAVEALRKIDPSLRLVLIAPNGAAAEADWAQQGLDDCIQSPIAQADLNRIFEDEALLSISQPSEDIQAVADRVMSSSPNLESSDQKMSRGISLDDLRQRLSASDYAIPAIATGGVGNPVAGSSAPEVASSPEPTVSVDSPPHINAQNTDDSQRCVRDLSSPDQSSEPSTFARQSLQRGLGDTDLLETVMSPTGKLCHLALELIAQQTGWTDLALGPESNPKTKVPNPNSAWPSETQVVWETQSFGCLTSAQATIDQLQPWAQWLAKWLALNRTYQDYRLKAMQDDLTGAWNRRFFDSFLTDSIARATKARRPVTVMVFDIDNFKSYNDEFGHAAGDDILREIVRLLTSVIRQGDRVCRIGGDEFVVIFADPEAPRAVGSTHPESVETIARRFQDQVCKMRYPKLGIEAPGTLSISAGLATFPWDGKDSQELLKHADELAMQSKRKGKNAITLGQGAIQACRSQEI